MRSKSFRVVGSAGGPTFSPVFIVDNYNNPCNIGIGVVVSGAHTIADVQHTFANPFSINLNTNVSAAAWELNSTLTSATQANVNGMASTNYAFGPTAIRMRIRAMASAGTGEAATITFQQAGPE